MVAFGADHDHHAATDAYLDQVDKVVPNGLPLFMSEISAEMLG